MSQICVLHVIMVLHVKKLNGYLIFKIIIPTRFDSAKIDTCEKKKKIKLYSHLIFYDSQTCYPHI